MPVYGNCHIIIATELAVSIDTQRLPDFSQVSTIGSSSSIEQESCSNIILVRICSPRDAEKLFKTRRELQNFRAETGNIQNAGCSSNRKRAGSLRPFSMLQYRGIEAMREPCGGEPQDQVERHPAA
jgi:hypothetical protein